MCHRGAFRKTSALFLCSIYCDIRSTFERPNMYGMMPMGPSVDKTISSGANKQLVVFSDLDGTLLDHDTYDWSPARPALVRLREHDIPLVLVSSKTLAELEDYRGQLQLSHPIVAENGASLRIPAGYFNDSDDFPVGSTPRSELRAAYEEVQRVFAFDCAAFYELGVPGIIRETGLTELQAQRANDREASEPILWRDSAERAVQFEQQMIARGLRCIQGGRFLHLLGNTGKEEAVQQLLDAYRCKWPDATLTSVSLGDGPNDLGMLSVTDIAVTIPGKHEHPMNLKTNNRVVRAKLPGPAGWNEAMLALLAEFHEDRLTIHRNGD